MRTRAETAGTAARVLGVLRVVAEASGTVGVKEVAVALNLPMSTSHRLLDLLVEAGFVDRDRVRHRYGIGSEFRRVANLVVRKTSLQSIVQPVLDDLARKTRETALLGLLVPEQNTMIYAAKADSPDPLRYRIDLLAPMPLAWGASGIAILAFQPEDVRARAIAAARSSPTGKRLGLEAHRARLEAVRQLGYAMTEGEKLPDSVGIAVPLETAPDVVGGSLAITIPKIRFDPALTRSYVAALRAAAARVSSQRPPP